MMQNTAIETTVMEFTAIFRKPSDDVAAYLQQILDTCGSCGPLNVKAGYEIAQTFVVTVPAGSQCPSKADMTAIVRKSAEAAGLEFVSLRLIRLGKEMPQ